MAMHETTQEQKKPGKQIVLELGQKRYDFALIKERSVRAPQIMHDVEELRGCKPTGINEIDNSIVRLCVVGKRVRVVSGYNKVKAALDRLVEVRTAGVETQPEVEKPTAEAADENFDSAKAMAGIVTKVQDDADPTKIKARMMGYKFLESAVLPPRQITGDELTSATSKLAAHFGNSKKK